MGKRGNPDNLRAAARRKHQAAVERAEQALRALIRNNEPITFRAVARLADCSPNFLYSTPALRDRITQLRAQPRRPIASAPPAAIAQSSNVIRELAGQIADEKRRRRDEVAALEAALAAAQGELLELRRRVAVTPFETTPSRRQSGANAPENT